MKRFNLGLGAALLVGAACFSLVSGEAAPAAGAASRTVTFTLTDSGKARWSTDGDAEKGSLALNYAWHGTLRFKVPAKARFLAVANTTLRASWTGDAVGTNLPTRRRGALLAPLEGDPDAESDEDGTAEIVEQGPDPWPLEHGSAARCRKRIAGEPNEAERVEERAEEQQRRQR